MPNSIVVDNGTTATGIATDNLSSDSFLVYGPNNTISTVGGNETVLGGTLAPYGIDTATAIFLGATSGDPASNVAVAVSLTLDGGNNEVGAGSQTAPSFATLYNSTVSITVRPPASGMETGGNLVEIDNITDPTRPGPVATNTVSLTGSDNQVLLGTAANNTVTFDQGFNLVEIGLVGGTTPFGGNGILGYTDKITLAGDANEVIAGDSDNTITGGGSGNQIILGNGDNTVTLSGAANAVSVGDGTNTINAGALGNSLVRIDQFGTGKRGNDQVALAGTSNIVQQASGGTSDVSVSDASGDNKIILANGVDTVTLGGGSNVVVVGQGADTITFTDADGFNQVVGGNGDDLVVTQGSNNAIALGNGSDDVTVSGNSNQIALGNGNDSVSLGSGIDDGLQLGTGSNVVNGAAPGGSNTIVAHDQSSSINVLNLDTEIGNNIGLGDGTNLVTDNGDLVAIAAGNGNNSITANGNADTLTLLNGNNSVSANGNGDTITLGQDGQGGSNTLSAVGSGDVVSVYGHGGATPSTDVIAIGTNSSLTAHGGIEQVTAGNVSPIPVFAESDTVTLDGTTLGSTTQLLSSDDTLILQNNANDVITGAATVVVEAAAGAYTGDVVADFGLSLGTVDLQGFGFDHVGAGPGGFDPILNDAGTAYVAALPGGGQITFTAPTVGVFTTDIKFS